MPPDRVGASQISPGKIEQLFGRSDRDQGEPSTPAGALVRDPGASTSGSSSQRFEIRKGLPTDSQQKAKGNGKSPQFSGKQTSVVAAASGIEQTRGRNYDTTRSGFFVDDDPGCPSETGAGASSSRQAHDTSVHTQTVTPGDIDVERGSSPGSTSGGNRKRPGPHEASQLASRQRRAPEDSILQLAQANLKGKAPLYSETRTPVAAVTLRLEKTKLQPEGSPGHDDASGRPSETARLRSLQQAAHGSAVSPGPTPVPDKRREYHGSSGPHTIGDDNRQFRQGEGKAPYAQYPHRLPPPILLGRSKCGKTRPEGRSGFDEASSRSGEIARSRNSSQVHAFSNSPFESISLALPS